MTEFKAFSPCAIHDVEEPCGANTYRICFECGHVWETMEVMVKFYRIEFFEVDPTIQDKEGDEISFCPLCLHDW